MQNEPVTTARLLDRIEIGWSDLLAFVDGLTEEQMTSLTDAVGWTVKDHLLHISAWENGVLALLNGQSRHAAMGVTADIWASKDDDVINAAIQQNMRDLPLGAALEQFLSVHSQFVARIG